MNHFLDKTLTFRVIQDGYILPYTSYNEGGVFDSDGGYVKGSSYTEGNHHGYKRRLSDNSGIKLSVLADEQRIEISEVFHDHSTAVYIGIMLKVWGHFITTRKKTPASVACTP